MKKLMIFIGVVLVMSIGMHELVHIMINSHAGCGSELHITWWGVYVIKDCPAGADLNNLMLAHMINESINYNISLPAYGCFITLLCISYIQGKRYLNEKETKEK